MKRLNVIFALALSIFLMQSCQKDDITDPNDPQGQEAPQLPPAESFVMPFEDFSGSKESQVLRKYGVRSCFLPYPQN